MSDDTTPASDQLSKAVEPIESLAATTPPERTTPSERASEAWDSVPGDSEATVDYADPDDVTHTAKVVDLKRGHPDTHPEETHPEGYLMGGSIVAQPELRVQTTIYFPNGGTVEVTESTAYEDDEEWVGEDVVVLLENVHGMLKHRF